MSPTVLVLRLGRPVHSLISPPPPPPTTITTDASCPTGPPPPRSLRPPRWRTEKQQPYRNSPDNCPPVRFSPPLAFFFFTPQFLLLRPPRLFFSLSKPFFCARPFLENLFDSCFLKGGEGEKKIPLDFLFLFFFSSLFTFFSFPRDKSQAATLGSVGFPEMLIGATGLRDLGKKR